MSVVVVTGSSGLVGSEAVRWFHGMGFDVVGIDNNMREFFFGTDGSTKWNARQLTVELPRFTHEDADIRDQEVVERIFGRFGKDIELVIHAAAQPSHDWAAKHPMVDFTVNANGTLTMLEATRRFCPDATFIFTSTNKVYGDAPNQLPLVEMSTRWEVDAAHPCAAYGIDETMNVDQSMHSVFGASKLAADVLTQEYGRYFGLKTGTFRGGCLTGPAHSGAELHGFLAYLVKCGVSGRMYTVYGYKGKQVRDSIHASDLISAFSHFHQKPKTGAVYNIGGSRHSNCSVIEAIQMVEKITGRPFNYTVSEDARAGDHIWYVTDVRSFQRDYPEWTYQYDLTAIVEEIVDATEERMKSGRS